MRILLVEPSYKNKYPPIGLMKISTYHKLLKDDVVFCKGQFPDLKKQIWDRIYISTVFTFHWKIVIDTIYYYLGSVSSSKNLIIGGPMATIMADEISTQNGLENIIIIKGLLDNPGVLDDNNYIIDELIPDYSIIKNDKHYVNYDYPIQDAYFIHSTRGCIRHCEFCAVPKIEPDFKCYVDIKPRIVEIETKYGVKKDLMIMDNNVLASPCFEQIINDIIECGFGRDNNKLRYTLNGNSRSKKRYVDFNQGLDARILYQQPQKMELLSRLAINPLRIAFDHADDNFVKIYMECMRMAAKNNISNASNYILFNFNDTPKDLYNRLKVNVELNREFKEQGFSTKIWSFPMRYSPLFGEHAKDRKHVGKYWSSKQIRGIQCILNATHGIVGPNYDFFKRAFGKSLEEFEELIWMPDDYIIYRKVNEENGNADCWKENYKTLSIDEQFEFKQLISTNILNNITSDNPNIIKLLLHYKLKNHS